MPTEHDYNREADDIDEIQEEDRQERMAKKKAKASHLRYLRHEAKIAAANAEKANDIQQGTKSKELPHSTAGGKSFSDGMGQTPVDFLTKQEASQ